MDPEGYIRCGNPKCGRLIDPDHEKTKYCSQKCRKQRIYDAAKLRKSSSTVTVSPALGKLPATGRNNRQN